MTAAARVDLDHRDTQFGHAFGVAGVLDIPFNHPDAVAVPKGQDRLFHQGGFAGAGGAHEIDDINLFFVEQGSIVRSDPVVGIEHIFYHADFHIFYPFFLGFFQDDHIQWYW